MATSTPLQGKNKAITAKRTPTTGAGKAKGKPNGNIMSFFKRAETSDATITDVQAEVEEDEPLFLEDSPLKAGAKMPLQTPTPPREESSIETWPEGAGRGSVESPASRYNEDPMPSKRQRIEDTPRQLPPLKMPNPGPTMGPFVDDSDSDDEPPDFGFTGPDEESRSAVRNTTSVIEAQAPEKDPTGPAVPSLKQEMTSIREVNDFDGIEDFIDDEFPEEGEEYLERRWMEEQAEFEESLEEDQATEVDTMDMQLNTTRVMPQDAGSTSCPICGGNTTGLTDQV